MSDDAEFRPQRRHRIRVHAISNSDALGYLGQQAISAAVSPGDDYRIVGGHMVRLLLEVYPTPQATARSTLDADAAVGDVEVVGPLSERLRAQDFVKAGGSVFLKQAGGGQQIEINLLLPGLHQAPGIRPKYVPGVGQVDSLPELFLVMQSDPLHLDVTAILLDGQAISYPTRIPDVAAAVILKAHAWKARLAEKDVADLHSLLEIREAHPEVPWRLADSGLIGFKRDTAQILYELAERVVRKNAGFPVPAHLDRKRMAGLVLRHVAQPRPR